VVVAWLLFPLVLLVVCVGCGLLVERVAGWRLPGLLIPSAGLALVIVAATLTTSLRATAPLTTPLVGLLTLVGYACSWRRVRGLKLDAWAVGVGTSVLAVCAAPVVLSGNATFLGYNVLNDSATHFALIDQLLSRGRDISGLPASSLSVLLHSFISTSYPIGADVAVGAVRPLVGQDIAWIFQPYLAMIVVFGSLAIQELLRGLVRSAPLRAVCAFVAAQPGLLYAYYLQASIKELATTWIITVTVVLVFAPLRRRLHLRCLAPLIIVVVAGLDVLDLAIVPWLGPPVAIFALLTARRMRSVGTFSSRRLALAAAGGVTISAALAAPIISTVPAFFSTAESVLTQRNDLGNLPLPLLKWEMVGIWPNGDFRFAVSAHYRIIYALIGVAIASAVLGAISAVRRRAFAPLLLIGGNGIAATYLLIRASPYASGKVMTIFSLTIVLSAMLGPAALQDSGRRFEAWVLAAAIGGGVLWTNALAYRAASIPPRDRFAELASIGTRFSGRGPTFFNLADEFAIHFLRGETPTVPVIGSPVARAGLPARTPAQVRLPWDPDDLAPIYLEQFRLLVLGRSPRVSHPPGNYQLAYSGRFYDVWRRTSTPAILEHIALGGALNPAAVPSCRLVTATAEKARRAGARLAYVARPTLAAFVPSQASHPPDWRPATGDPFALVMPGRPGPAAGWLPVPVDGRYQVWLQGSFSQRFQVWIGGHQVGSVAYELGPLGQFVQLGDVTLGAGEEPARIAPSGDDLAPGNGGRYRLIGPLMLVRQSPPPAPAEIDPRRARALCGRSLDWLEIVR
jgi:hypothetical protein